MPHPSQGMICLARIHFQKAFPKPWSWVYLLLPLGQHVNLRKLQRPLIHPNEYQNVST